MYIFRPLKIVFYQSRKIIEIWCLLLGLKSVYKHEKNSWELDNSGSRYSMINELILNTAEKDFEELQAEPLFVLLMCTSLMCF